jgi:hypothetical protein
MMQSWAKGIRGTDVVSFGERQFAIVLSRPQVGRTWSTTFSSWLFSTPLKH